MSSHRKGLRRTYKTAAIIADRSETVGRKRAKTLFFDLDHAPELGCAIADRRIAGAVAVAADPLVHCPLDFCLRLGYQLVPIKLAADFNP